MVCDIELIYLFPEIPGVGVLLQYPSPPYPSAMGYSSHMGSIIPFIPPPYAHPAALQSPAAFGPQPTFIPPNMAGAAPGPFYTPPAAAAPLGNVASAPVHASMGIPTHFQPPNPYPAQAIQPTQTVLQPTQHAMQPTQIITQPTQIVTQPTQLVQPAPVDVNRDARATREAELKLKDHRRPLGLSVLGLADVF